MTSEAIGESFSAPTATETISYKLHKKADRWEGRNVSYRYLFKEVKRTPKTTESGVVLEEPQTTPSTSGLSLNSILADPKWKDFDTEEPEGLPDGND